MNCGHTNLHKCTVCGQCNSCKHTYHERADGWWKKCPTLKIVKVIAKRMAS